MRSLLRGCVALGAALVLTGGMLGVGRAASPSSGTLDRAHHNVTWTGGPLVGSAAAYRRIPIALAVCCQ